MDDINAVCFKWGKEYRAKHVNVLDSMLKRNYSGNIHLTCFTDDRAGIKDSVQVYDLPETVKGYYLTAKKRRYIKLWFYSKEMSAFFPAQDSRTRLLLLDLDIVITGSLDVLLDRKEDVVFWDDPDKKTPYNSSIVLYTLGSRAHIWDSFDPETSPQQCEKALPVGQDQVWAGLKAPNEALWYKSDGIYSMRQDVMRGNGTLPEGAKVVVFHGPRDPAKESFQEKYPWILEHWYE